MAMFLEEAGIPTVPINTHVFARLARATSSAYGMPTMRNVYVPQPVVGRTPDELRADFDEALSLIPGRHRVNLHAMYGEFGGKKVDRSSAIAP